MFETDLVQRKTIAEIVDVYRLECANVKRAYDTLWQAKNNLESAFGGEYSQFDTFPERSRHDETAGQDVLDRLKCEAWKSVINRLKLHRLVSPKRWKELQEKIGDPKQMPDLNMTTVSEIFAAYEQNATKYLEEAIREVYDYLRPRSEYGGAKYVTNQKNARFEIGRKIIITNIISNRYGKGAFHVNYQDEQKLVSLDMVFVHLAGGAVPDGYRSPIVDAINTADSNVVDTDMFRVKCYINGNLHLEFKRLDLLAKFNAVAGGMNLNPIVKERA